LRPRGPYFLETEGDVAIAIGMDGISLMGLPREHKPPRAQEQPA
jgi:hypothetical protein